MNKQGTFVKTETKTAYVYKVYDQNGKHIDTLKGGRHYYAIAYALVRNEETGEYELLGSGPKRYRNSYGRPDLLAKAVRPTDNVLVCTEGVPATAPQPSYEEDLASLRKWVLANAPEADKAMYIGASRHELTPDEVHMLMNGVRYFEQTKNTGQLASFVAHDLVGLMKRDEHFVPRFARFFQDPTGQHKAEWHHPTVPLLNPLKSRNHDEHREVIIVGPGLPPAPAYETLEDMMPEVVDDRQFLKNSKALGKKK